MKHRHIEKREMFFWKIIFNCKLGYHAGDRTNDNMQHYCKLNINLHQSCSPIICPKCHAVDLKRELVYEIREIILE